MIETLTVFKQALWLSVLLSAPPLLAAVLVGVGVSLAQALTQIQDQTLPYVIKLVVVAVVLVACGRWIGAELLQLTIRCIDLVATVGR
jgi:type III secretion protein S